MDNGGWNERDAIEWTIKGLREEVEQLREKNKTLEIEKKVLKETLQGNELYKQKKQLENELKRVYNLLDSKEKELKESKTANDFERAFLDHLYRNTKIIIADDYIKSYTLQFDTFWFRGVMFDNTIKDYLISKGVEEE